MTVYGYARVSTEDQHLDGQLSTLKLAGCTVVYQEKASGADDERVELSKLMGRLTRGDTVVVCKLDRIARSTQHLLRLVEDMDRRGVTFRILNISIDTGTPTGKMMLTILASIATFEREMMLERQRDGIVRAKGQGKYKGRRASTMDQADMVLGLLDLGIGKHQIAQQCNIGIASVYRIIQRTGGGRQTNKPTGGHTS